MFDIGIRGVVLYIFLVIGLGLGWLIDSLAGTSPACTFAGLALGILGAGAFTISKFRMYLGPSNTSHNPVSPDRPDDPQS